MCFFFKRLRTFVRKASATTPSLGASIASPKANRRRFPHAFSLRLAYFQVFFEVSFVTAFREAKSGLGLFEFLFSVKRVRRGRLRGGKRAARGGFHRQDDVFIFSRRDAIANVSQTLKLIRRVFDRDIGNFFAFSRFVLHARVRSDCV